MKKLLNLLIILLFIILAVFIVLGYFGKIDSIIPDNFKNISKAKVIENIDKPKPAPQIRLEINNNTEDIIDTNNKTAEAEVALTKNNSEDVSENISDNFFEIEIHYLKNIETYYPALINSEYILFPYKLVKDSNKIVINSNYQKNINFKILGFDEIYNLIIFKLDQEKTKGFKIENIDQNPDAGHLVSLGKFKNKKFKYNCSISKSIKKEFNYLYYGWYLNTTFNEINMTSSVMLNQENKLIGLNLFYNYNLTIPAEKIINIINSFEKYGKIKLLCNQFFAEDNNNKMFVNSVYSINGNADTMFQKNDRIIAINSNKINSVKQYINITNELLLNNSEFYVTLLRNNEQFKIPLKISNFIEYPVEKFYGFNISDYTINDSVGLSKKAILNKVLNNSVFSRFNIKTGDTLSEYNSKPITSENSFLYEILYKHLNSNFKITTRDKYILNISEIDDKIKAQ